MSGQQKRGFRLPWGTASDPDGGAAAATLEPGTPDPTMGEVRDDLGEGPFGLADATPQLITDADPAASDVPESNTEAAMIETETSNQAAQEAPARPSAGGAWPETDTAARMAARVVPRPAIRVGGEPVAPRVPRRDNPLVAGLVKAMREAAIASREETTSRLQGEATARIETIRTRATSEVGELKKRADEDVAGIREWSKAEMARIKQETDVRIEARRTVLEGETERHAAGVAQLVDEVETVVLQFEEDMDQFFVNLLAETDPAKLAALAEQAPEPPDLRGDGPTALDLMQEPAEDPRAAIRWEDAETTSEGAGAAPDAAPGLEASAAAEAEAAATEGLDLSDADQWPAAVTAAARRGDPANDADAEAAAAAHAEGAELTRLIVSGLSSVAGISAFKGALGMLQGVHAVSVTSGEPGSFVFQVHHDPEVDLASGVASLHGFAARITDATADGVTVVAHEPVA
ncbi:MAG TPA: hypothetical protein VM451_07445 [Candidatus Limnocylindria bacterium]|nr:hypothetical protein [Candidatus Limnocylindria bacterium]